MFEDRTERIQALISIADRFQQVPAEIAVHPYPEERRVPGCESEVFIWAMPNENGTLKFHFGVDNPQGVSAMALATVLDESLSGEPLRDVMSVPDGVVFEIFGSELSMGKSMGLINMVRTVKAEAKRASANQ